MNTNADERATAKLPRWADAFPYVNGGLFSGSTETPRFSKIARSYLIHIGRLDWKKINPDIFGSMIQAVAEEEERGALGMHYTSVPNILKVLNPLFLDDLRAKLEEAGDNPRTLLNLRKRIARIRVFDPACGSGNFLVVAYKKTRDVEAEINKRRGEPERRSDIPLTNFRGIEVRDFPAEIARLALIIAEYQCDVFYRGQKEALQDFLPLDAENWITCGNALRLDWLSICPPTGTGVKYQTDDLFHTPLDQASIDFENEGGETYICGNPPYKGGTAQGSVHKDDLEPLFDHRTDAWKSLDYVSGWFIKFADYAAKVNATCAFVATNSVCQGEQVSRLWPLVLGTNLAIKFAYTSFKWANLAAKNAGVTVVIIGLSSDKRGMRVLYNSDQEGNPTRQEVSNINAYLVPGPDLFVAPETRPLSDVTLMTIGNKPVDGGNLIMSADVARDLTESARASSEFVRPYVGAEEAIKGIRRFCLWIKNEDVQRAMLIPAVATRIAAVEKFRLASSKLLTRETARTPYAFQQIRQSGEEWSLIIPSVSSEARQYLPIILEPAGAIISNAAFALLNPPYWSFSLIASRLHLIWIATVCGKLETRYRYSNTLGWNTFPVPRLTEKNEADLTRCAEDILLAREAHFPATIADLYDPDNMPADLREAHLRNDEVLERIYIGRRFRNDTERLEKLFDLYTKMTAGNEAAKIKRKAGAGA